MYTGDGGLRPGCCAYCKSPTKFIIRSGKCFLVMSRTFLLIILWPLAMTIDRFVSEAKFATAYGLDKFRAQKAARDYTVISSRARIIEVCIESSFQPLFQLYLLLPILLDYFECGAYSQFGKTSLEGALLTVSELQFWSVFTGGF